MTKLDLFCLQMTEKQAISSNNLHFCFSALLLRTPSRSQAYFTHVDPDGVLRLRLLNAGQLHGIYDKYDIGHYIYIYDIIYNPTTMYVCVHMYVYVCVHVCNICMCVHVCVRVCVCACVSENLCGLGPLRLFQVIRQ